MLKECGFHLVDGGIAEGDNTLHNGREVGGDKVASLLATMAAHALAMGSVLGTGADKYGATEVLVKFKLLQPPVQFP